MGPTPPQLSKCPDLHRISEDWHLRHLIGEYAERGYTTIQKHQLDSLLASLINMICGFE